MRLNALDEEERDAFWIPALNAVEEAVAGCLDDDPQSIVFAAANAADVTGFAHDPAERESLVDAEATHQLRILDAVEAAPAADLSRASLGAIVEDVGWLPRFQQLYP